MTSLAWSPGDKGQLHRCGTLPRTKRRRRVLLSLVSAPAQGKKFSSHLMAVMEMAYELSPPTSEMDLTGPGCLRSFHCLPCVCCTCFCCGEPWATVSHDGWMDGWMLCSAGH